jgi:hypothetical protein
MLRFLLMQGKYCVEVLLLIQLFDGDDEDINPNHRCIQLRDSINNL